MDAPSAPAIPKRLFAELLTYFIGSLLLAGAFHTLLARAWNSEQADTWFLVAAVLLLYQWTHLALGLANNRRVGENRILPSFGWASAVSFIRLVAIAFLAGFLALQAPSAWLAWLPATLYLLAISSDLVDGYVARITHRVTRLGQELDEVLDGRGLLVVSWLALHYGRVGWWYLGIGLARYLYLVGLKRREGGGAPIYPLEPNMNRRALAGTQMVFSLAMLAPLFAPPETILVSSLFMLPFLGNFLIDWWQVSGQARPLEAWRRFSGKYLAPHLPNLLGLARLLIVLAVIGRWSTVRLPAGVYVLEALLGLAITLGILGRTASALLLIETGLRQQAGPLGPFDWVIFVLATLTLFFGTGRWSLHAPEGTWVQRRAGEERVEVEEA